MWLKSDITYERPADLFTSHMHNFQSFVSERRNLEATFDSVLWVVLCASDLSSTCRINPRSCNGSGNILPLFLFWGWGGHPINHQRPGRTDHLRSYNVSSLSISSLCCMRCPAVPFSRTIHDYFRTRSRLLRHCKSRLNGSRRKCKTSNFRLVHFVTY